MEFINSRFLTSSGEEKVPIDRDTFFVRSESNVLPRERDSESEWLVSINTSRIKANDSGRLANSRTGYNTTIASAQQGTGMPSSLDAQRLSFYSSRPFRLFWLPISCRLDVT